LPNRLLMNLSRAQYAINSHFGQAGFVKLLIF
jgi:hypothetical protein